MFLELPPVCSINCQHYPFRFSAWTTPSPQGHAKLESHNKQQRPLMKPTLYTKKIYIYIYGFFLMWA